MVIGVIALGGLAVWLLPVLLTRYPHLANPVDRYSAEASVRTGLVALLAVLGGLGGLYYTGRTFRLSQETQRLSAEGQITDRYSKAVDQLGDESPEVSLGGLYALGRIMRDSPRDEQAVVAVISAFVRRAAKLNDSRKPPWPPGEAERDDVKPSFRIQAALNVIASREHRDEAAVPDLRDSDLRGARLRNAQLRGSSLRRSYLYKAHLTGVDLSEASLVEADFTDASLTQANLMEANLKRANLTRANLSRVNLVGADLRNSRLVGTEFKGADLRGAHLTIGALSPGQRQAVVNGDKIVWDSRQITKVPGKQLATTPIRKIMNKLMRAQGG